MKSPSPQKPWQRKSMRHLMLAALCVTWTGFTFNSHPDLINFTVSTVTTVLLVLFVYGFDDIMDVDENLRRMRNPTVQFLGWGALACVVVCFFASGLVSFLSSLATLAVGTLYSFRYRKSQIKSQLKSYFFLKNILIGLGWGLLVFLGSNSVSSESIFITFLFFSIQVVIGSVIRDFDDVEEDKKNQISTLPIVLGLKGTVFSMHLLNLISALILLISFHRTPQYKMLWFFWMIVVIYRAGLIEKIRKQVARSYLLQQVNIMACALVFIGRVVQMVVF